MSGNTLGAEYAALQKLENDIDAHVQHMDQQIGRLNNIVDGVKSSWKGQGAAAYTTLQTQVNEDARKLRQVLHSIKEAVQASKTGFSAADDEQSANFRGMGGGDIIGRLS